MHILFISTHNFATNPRLVKEIDLAVKNNYKVSVLCFEFDNWSKAINLEIYNRLKINSTIILLPAGRNPFMPWLMSSFFSQLSSILLNLLPKNIFFLSMISNKRSWLLLKNVKKIKSDISLVVGHNAGSFYPAMKFAKQKKIPFGIDLEDYHPGEVTDIKIGNYLKRLSKQILPQASYLTAASELILEYTLKDTGDYKKEKKVVLNFFSSDEFIVPQPTQAAKLKLVWFSQNIAAGRGLEQLIFVIKNLNEYVELHLYGNLKQNFYNEYLKDVNNVIVHNALPQKELHNILSTYDVGLAIEPGKDVNNDLAISNKILAYMQAGLFVLASNTSAQKSFLNQHPDIGFITELKKEPLTNTFAFLIEYNKRNLLRNSERFSKAKNFNWETESKKLIYLWQKVMA